MGTILSIVTQKIYGAEPQKRTEVVDSTEYVTHITGPGFKYKYTSTDASTADKTEAKAIYYFLKHVTNVLGYTIVDENYSSLAAVLPEIDWFNAQINQLQLCAEDAVALTHWIHTGLQQNHDQTVIQITDNNLAYIASSAAEIITTVKNQCIIADQALHLFKEQKVTENVF